MARRSRRAVAYGSVSLVEHIQSIVSEIGPACLDGTLVSSSRIHSFRIRLSDALRNVRRLSHLLGPCHANIVSGVEEMLALLRNMDTSTRERDGYTPHHNAGKFSC